MQPARNRDYAYMEFVSRFENNYQFRDVCQIPAKVFGRFCRRLCLKAMEVFKEEEEEFVNCLLQVDVDRVGWRRHLTKVLRSCRAVRQFNVDNVDSKGMVEVSAFAKPTQLMRRIERSTRIKLERMQAGGCSSNLFLKDAPKPSVPITSNQPPIPFPFRGGYGYPPLPPPHRGYGYPIPPPPSEIFEYGYGYGYRPPQPRFVFGRYLSTS